MGGRKAHSFEVSMSTLVLILYIHLLGKNKSRRNVLQRRRCFLIVQLSSHRKLLSHGATTGARRLKAIS